MKKSLLKSKLKQIFLKHKLSKNHAEICSNYLIKAEILIFRNCSSEDYEFEKNDYNIDIEKE